MMFYAFNFTLVPNVAIILLNHTTHIILHTVPFPFCHIFYIGAGYTQYCCFSTLPHSLGMRLEYVLSPRLLATTGPKGHC